MIVPSLSSKDLTAILDIVHMVNDDHGELEMPQQVLPRLGALVGCHMLSYVCTDLTSGRRLVIIDEPYGTDPSRLPGFDAVIFQHPVANAYQRGQVRLGTVVTLNDLADMRSLRRLPLHVDFHEPYGIHDQLFCVVRHSSQQIAGLVFNRARRGFSLRDRAVVDLITPHLIQAAARRQRIASLSAAVRSLRRHADQMDQAGPQLSQLTSREREIVEHLLGGLTDREIARSLAISPRTVHKHLESTYRKLNIGNRTSLIALTLQTDGRHSNLS